MLAALAPLIAMDQTLLIEGASELIGSVFPTAQLNLPPGSAHPNKGFFAFAIRAILFGYILKWANRLYARIEEKVHEILFPTAYIPSADPAVKWIQAWIAADPAAQKQLNDFVLHTRESGKTRGSNRNQLRDRDYYKGSGRRISFNDETASWTSGMVIGTVLPLPDQVIRIRFRGWVLWIENEEGRRYDSGTGQCKITTFGFQRHALRAFIAAAHAAYFCKEEHELLIFHSETYSSDWTDPISRPVRPWSSVILPLKDAIYEDMKRFLSEKEAKWYTARGIPHRRGYLFHGEPGAGKTTLVTALASKLRLDIYVISISQSGMDDNKLCELFRNCEPNSVILLEDIDRVFVGNQTISTGTTQTSPGVGQSFVIAPRNGRDDGSISSDKSEDEPVRNKSKREGSVVTMSGLLNAIDGVSSQEGCLLIASTNHLDRLDPALTRAGRFDVRVPFHSTTPEQARLLFLHFFPIEDFIDPTSSCHKATTEAIDPESKTINQFELDNLADAFVGAVFPDGELGGVGGVEGSRVAMASVQAYLLNFKESPREAVEQAAEWARSAEEGNLLLHSPSRPEFS